MNLIELLKQLEDNTIKIDLFGHNNSNKNNWHRKHIIEDLITKVKWAIETSENFENGKYLNADITNIQQNRFLDVFAFENNYECQLCGCGYSIKPSEDGLKIEMKDKTNPEICEYASNMIEMKSKIFFPTGKVLFTNHFGYTIEDAPKNEEHTNKYSLCTLYGRKNITRYLEQQNIGFGQVGNTSIGVWVNKTKDKVILSELTSPEYYKYYKKYTEEDLKKKDPMEVQWFKETKELIDNGFKCKGKISLDVWRWMCIDESLLSEESKKVDWCDKVTVKLKKGYWNVNHYYDTAETNSSLVAELNLFP